MNKYKDAEAILLSKYELVCKRYRKSMTGYAYFNSNQIEYPDPLSAISFSVFAHEVGHKALNHNGDGKSCLKEYDAWQFSFNQFKAFNFAITHKVKREANLSISYGLAQALNRGLKSVPDELKPYKRFLIVRKVHQYSNGKYSIVKRYYVNS